MMDVYQIILHKAICQEPCIFSPYMTQSFLKRIAPHTDFMRNVSLIDICLVTPLAL